ncbi:hypothetical protein AV530_000558 [Patagioenas fasciata monilis]|uniref:Uncharacterized protein n=1 Tax=Patagioenas fasciata monilis TaxID=372326 RepID=A0A1V4IFW3_PATFA|nr:hypothetical protein AV530_000558 [Patagioenas fasciata monilis]
MGHKMAYQGLQVPQDVSSSLCSLTWKIPHGTSHQIPVTAANFTCSYQLHGFLGAETRKEEKFQEQIVND